ncbi:hypothetical protein MMC25_005224 [Agyrium rufum]|nr:hypothetical protein [Agyrium rufum]
MQSASETDHPQNKPGLGQHSGVPLETMQRQTKAPGLHIELPDPDLCSIHGSDEEEGFDHDEDDEDDGHQIEMDGAAEDIRTIMGVSIGREQTRLKSPTTPAPENMAVMQDMFDELLPDAALADGDGAHDEPDTVITTPSTEATFAQSPEEMDPFSAQDSSERTDQVRVTHPQLPTPWTASPKIFEVERAPQSGLSPIRNRSKTFAGPTSILADLNISRFLSSFSVPSPGFLKDLSFPQLPSMLGGGGGGGGVKTNLKGEEGTREQRSNSFRSPRFMWGSQSRSRAASEGTATKSRPGQAPSPLHSPSLEHPPQVHNQPPKPIISSSGSSTLRRIQSDNSLRPTSTISRISTLGDDTRWDHVQEQVNNRMKAVMDSFQDSNLKFPGLPSIMSLRPDAKIKEPRHVQAGIDATKDGREQERVARRLKSLEKSSELPSPSVPIKTAYRASQRYLDMALEGLMGDIIVMGGYRGSVLRSRDTHRQLWIPVKVGLNIRRADLEVGLNPEDEETMHERIYSSSMLSHIGPVDISRRLIKRLRLCRNAQEGRLRIHNYGYDWRLSPALLSKRFQEYVSGMRCNRPDVPTSERGVTVIAHSLGGLITRHAVNQHPELFAGVLYAGVPQHCVNILGPFRNGDEVLLSSKVLTAQVNFTIRTSYALLPESGRCFIDKDTKEEYPVDFFDVDDWEKYAWSPCISLPTPLEPDAGNAKKKGLLHTISGAMPSMPSVMRPPFHSPHNSQSESQHRQLQPSNIVDIAAAKAENLTNPIENSLKPTTAPAQSSSQPSPPPSSTNPSTTSPASASTCTIPLPLAKAYLTRTLAETLLFKRSLAHIPTHQTSNLYPPHAIMYAANTPTVFGARVSGRDGIRRVDAYDNLAFASGDGVVLARAALLPEGYVCARGGRVRSERGHVGLLGDLEGVGRALLALGRARRGGVGLGVEDGKRGDGDGYR